MKSVTILLLTISLFGCDSWEQRDDISGEKSDQPSHVIPDSLRVPGVDSIVLGVYVDDTSTRPKQAAAAVTYMTSTQVEAKIATVAASIKTAYTAAIAIIDKKYAAKTKADSLIWVKKIADLVQVNITQAKTNKLLSDQIASLPKNKQDSIFALIQDLKKKSDSYFYRLEKDNTRLYELEFDDSTQNIDINYAKNKAWDTERRLNSYTTRTDSLMVSVDLSQFTIVGDKLTIAKWQTLVDALKKFGINL